MDIIDHVEALNDGSHATRVPAGNVIISIAVGEYSYCRPRVSGIPFHAYESVELAILNPEGLTDGSKPLFVIPTTCEMSGRRAQWLDPFAHLFGCDQVAGYVTWEEAQAIADACCEAGAWESE